MSCRGSWKWKEDGRQADTRGMRGEAVRSGATKPAARRFEHPAGANPAIRQTIQTMPKRARTEIIVA
ncbi:hypothetical protein BSIN_5041 [Burkholderia singularis]|uniref:Uncharacterized protein n=1 Tax=Burkholderia singularis TaxID=1503053 RepID=A0A238HBI0_9BURK|nr:hypothetical protein BSIN_5041 [Burkholderia singularis]